jgi:hypothetical protein
MNEEMIVEEVKEELPVEEEVIKFEGEQEEKEIVETRLVVKEEEFLNDYHALEKEKEETLIKGLEELDKRVEERIEALRPEIVEAVKEEIKKEVEAEYDEKIKFYEKYVEEVIVQPIEEDKQVEEVEETNEVVENIEQSQVNA